MHATNHDFRNFAEEELRFRLEFGYPPFTRMARILVSASSSDEAESGATRLFETLSRLKVTPSVDIIGPAPALNTSGAVEKTVKNFVASKSGTKYHALTCPGAKQIKESNKIFFAAETDAEAAGYTRAANCKF